MHLESKNKISNAITLFKKGQFKESKLLFSDFLNSFPEHVSGLFYNGYIDLLENRLRDAEHHFQKALGVIKCQNCITKILQSIIYKRSIESLLTYTYYRLNEFVKAIEYSKSINRKYCKKELAYWGNNKPYSIFNSKTKSVIDFEITDPLPLIKVSINGASPVYFFIDTGAGELIIDTEYAKALCLTEYRSDRGLFGGGKMGSFANSYINSIQLGDILVNNVPVIVMDTRRFSKELYNDKYKVDGILGTSILSQFLTTLDYSNNKIVFEIINHDTNSSFEKTIHSENYTRVPFWMAADHFVLIKGKVNNSDEMLLFLDTGLAGLSFTCPGSTVKRCKFVLKKNEIGYGLGGGGKMKAVPFDIDTISLGNIQESKLQGVYGPFPAQIENSFGFKIDGLISHQFFRKHQVIFDFSKMVLYIK